MVQRDSIWYTLPLNRVLNGILTMSASTLVIRMNAPPPINSKL